MNIRQALLTIGIFGLTGCASWQQFDGYLSERPPASVIEAGRVPGFDKRFASLELQRIDEFVGNGSLGKNELIGTVKLEVDINGLISEVGRLTWGNSADGKVQGVIEVQQLSVCGLQLLSRDLSGKSVMPSVTIAVSPVAVTTTSTDAVRTSLERLVVESLSGEVHKMCSPELNAEYEYQVSRQAQRRWSAAQNHRLHLVARVNCRASGAPVPARSVVPGLRGDAIEVRCKAKYANEGDHYSNFMYFGAIGIYLPIETSEPERGRTVYRYTKAILSEQH